MGDREGRHCPCPLRPSSMSTMSMSIVHVHEWERLRGLGGRKKMALKKKEFFRGTLRGPRRPKQITEY